MDLHGETEAGFSGVLQESAVNLCVPDEYPITASSTKSKSQDHIPHTHCSLYGR